MKDGRYHRKLEFHAPYMPENWMQYDYAVNANDLDSEWTARTQQWIWWNVNENADGYSGVCVYNFTLEDGDYVPFGSELPALDFTDLAKWARRWCDEGSDNPNRKGEE